MCGNSVSIFSNSEVQVLRVVFTKKCGKSAVIFFAKICCSEPSIKILKTCTLLYCLNLAIQMSLDNKPSMVINSYVTDSTEHLTYPIAYTVELNCWALNVAEMLPCLAKGLNLLGIGERSRAIVLGRRSISRSLRYISRLNNQMCSTWCQSKCRRVTN